MYWPNGQGDQVRSWAQGNASSRPPWGTINVIFTAFGRTSSHASRVMSVAQPPTKNSNSEPKRVRVEIQPGLSFSDEDKIGTIQPHDDVLMVTLKIGEYDVKRVLVDQGNCNTPT